MKKLIIAVAVVAILGGIGLYGGKVTGLLKNEVIVYRQAEPVVKTERVDNLDILIKEAQEEAKVRIETEAQKLYDDYVREEMVKVSDKVKEDYIAEIEATISSTEY
jgi:hypothetical protein